MNKIKRIPEASITAQVAKEKTISKARDRILVNRRQMEILVDM
jgi:hypothetical protein